MKILSIDTSSNICGVSILENTNLICKLDEDTGRTHSENLMPMISKAFTQSNLTLKNIDLLVCDQGPGSFTGIRIGLATIKAFHDTLAIPCIGISSLECLAYSIKNEGLIASIIDCKNDNCYLAIYELKDSKYREVLLPTATSIGKALSICKYHQNNNSLSNNPIIFVGDGSIVYKELFSNNFKNCIFAPYENNYLNSYYLGLAGLDKYHKNKFNGDEDVLPLYLKKPQAQRQLEEKLENIKISSMTFEELNKISDTLASDFDNFWSFSLLKDELNAENSTYIVAKFQFNSHEEIIGFAGFKTLLDEANIMNIVVRKDFRNQGVGSLLLKNLLLLASSQGISSITLEVMEENYSAIHLYRNFGFKQIGIRKNYYKDKNAIVMSNWRRFFLNFPTDSGF